MTSAFEGYDCNIPGEEDEPTPMPTLGDIQDAFLALPFGAPKATIQPAGLTTLVNLPTYYEAGWPKGPKLEPGELSDPQALLSVQVEFRVSPDSYLYEYGDGTDSGWTTSVGGPYPDGDITHTYDKPGTVPVVVRGRVTGEYRIDGGPWQPVGITADTVDEPVVNLRVAEAEPRLVSPGS